MVCFFSWFSTIWFCFLECLVFFIECWKLCMKNYRASGWYIFSEHLIFPDRARGDHLIWCHKPLLLSGPWILAFVSPTHWTCWLLFGPTLYINKCPQGKMWSCHIFLLKGSLQETCTLFGILVPQVLAVWLFSNVSKKCVCVCVLFWSAFIDVFSRRISLIPATSS